MSIFSSRPTPDPVGPGQESVWDYPRPPLLEPVTRRLRVVLGGTTIAEQQDRPDDWNIQLAAHLAPGTYRLELAPTGAEKAAAAQEPARHAALLDGARLEGGTDPTEPPRPDTASPGG